MEQKKKIETYTLLWNVQVIVAIEYETTIQK